MHINNLSLNLADGYYTWEVKTKDNMEHQHTSGSRSLYVDTQCPSVTLISPENCFKEVIGPNTKFNFTCEDALTAQYPSDLDLTYTLYVDGQPAGLPGDIDLEDLASEAGMDFADMLSLIYPNGSAGVMDSGAYKVEEQLSMTVFTTGMFQLRMEPETASQVKSGNSM